MSNKKDGNEIDDVTVDITQAIIDATDASLDITEIYTDLVNEKITEKEALKTMLEKKRVIMRSINVVENAALKLANPLLNTYLLMKYLDLKDLLKEADSTLNLLSPETIRSLFTENA